MLATFFGSKRSRRLPRRLQDASKTVQDAPRRPQYASTTPEDASKTAQEASKTPPRRLLVEAVADFLVRFNPFNPWILSVYNFPRKNIVLDIFSGAKRAFLGHILGPPKVPGGVGGLSPPLAPRILLRLGASQNASRRLMTPPRGAVEASKTPQDAPRSTQDAPRRPSRRPQDASRRLKTTPISKDDISFRKMMFHIEI